VADHRQIFAYSGLLQPNADGRATTELVDYALAIARSGSGPRMCYLATALGDLPAAIEAKQATFAVRRPDVRFSVLRLFPQPSVPDIRAHLLAQDVILVEGGSVVNLMAIWRAHGLPEILRDCWHAGVVLTGASAGSLCWHVGGPTDSFRDALDPFVDGLALLPFSNGVHDDLPDQPRRASYRAMVARGLLPAGYATEDGVGLHYRGTRLHQAVTIRPGARAWRVDPEAAGSYREQPIEPQPL
jgi:peptidase E